MKISGKVDIANSYNGFRGYISFFIPRNHQIKYFFVFFSTLAIEEK